MLQSHRVEFIAIVPQLTFICLTIETLEKGVKFVQNLAIYVNTRTISMTSSWYLYCQL